MCTGQQMLGTPTPISGIFPNIFPLAPGQATRHARRVYVGGLPPSANEQSAMSAIGGNTAGPDVGVAKSNNTRGSAVRELEFVLVAATQHNVLEGSFTDGESISSNVASGDVAAGIDKAVGFKWRRTNGVLHHVSSTQRFYVSLEFGRTVDFEVALDSGGA
nr:splicing factor U2af large subunit A-like [Ipomoea trifida]